ncbi:MAG: hypothetical protein OER97_09405 [Gammaproteobacteria bacterium]|nr:hypothetical protein [Gammaproteobacteria bacterium]
MRNDKIIEQLRRNAVALISLAIAITSLGYNTWRNEHTENNRNQRWASFEILILLGELKELIWLNHYDCNTSLRGNARTGWVYVESIEDLALVLEDMSADSSVHLHEVWQANWQAIDSEDTMSCNNRSEEQVEQGRLAKDEILGAIGEVRQDILRILHALD